MNVIEMKCRISELEEENEELKKQQQEFIKYLEKNINHYKKIIRVDKENNTEQDCRRFETRWVTYEEILSKYKEIIGVSNK